MGRHQGLGILGSRRNQDYLSLGECIATYCSHDLDIIQLLPLSLSFLLCKT